MNQRRYDKEIRSKRHHGNPRPQEKDKRKKNSNPNKKRHGNNRKESNEQEDSLKLPRDLYRLGNPFKSKKSNDAINLQLLYRYYVCWKKVNKEEGQESPDLEQWIKRLFGEEQDVGKIILPKENFLFFEYLESLQNKMFEALKNEGYSIFTIELEANWRVIIDMGTPSVYENGLNIHPFDSFPRIPGSAVKGVLRHFLEEMIQDLDEKENNTIRNIIKLLFGDSAQEEEANKGCLVFFDAIPVFTKNNNANMKALYSLDVMTPHYAPYYTQGDIPGDWHSPTPIPFLTFAPLKWRFRFALNKSLMKESSRRFLDESLEQLGYSKLKEFITSLLKASLKYRGIGAKTNSGYGYFIS